MVQIQHNNSSAYFNIPSIEYSLKFDRAMLEFKNSDCMLSSIYNSFQSWLTCAGDQK